MTTRRTKADQALELLFNVRKELLQSKPNLVSSLRTCTTVSTILGREREFEWISYESNGYPEKVQVPDYRKVLGSFYNFQGDLLKTRSVNQRYDVKIPVWRILDFSDPTDGLVLEVTPSQIRDVEGETQETPDTFEISASTLRYLLNSLTSILLDHTNKLTLELEYGGIPASIFEEIRAQVDEQFVTISKDAVSKLGLAYETLATGSDVEDWSTVALQCRKIIEDVADAVYPPRKELQIDDTGRPHDLGQENPVNRLSAFIAESSKGDDRRFLLAETQQLSSLLNQVNILANKAVHHKVERTHAKRCVIYTYLLLGDILLLRRESKT